MRLRYRAANKGNVDVVHLLIEWGTEVNWHDVGVDLLYSYTLRQGMFGMKNNSLDKYGL